LLSFSSSQHCDLSFPFFPPSLSRLVVVFDGDFRGQFVVQSHFGLRAS